MSTCHEPLSSPSSSTASLTIALAGNPNSGKTTIFNALTGLRQKVANYPGVTVEKKTGRCKLDDGRWVDIIDLPGTYSLISRSPDEQVAMEVLRGLRKDTPAPDMVIVVVDASNLQRNLYLVSQLIELGKPLVIALNMIDIAERRGIHVSAAKLQKQIGVPVVPIVGHKHRGISDLKSQISNAKVAPLPDWPLPVPMKDELMLVGGGLAIIDSRDDRAREGEAPAEPRLPENSARPEPRPPGAPTPPRAWICHGPDETRRLDRYQAIAERLLIGDHAGDIDEIAHRQPVAALLDSARSRLGQLGIDPMQADVEAHYRWIEYIAGGSIATLDELAAMGNVATPRDVLAYESAKQLTLTDKVDRILIHKVWGLAIFAVIMAILFVSIFWLAAPIMDGLSSAVTWLGGLASSRMSDGPLKDLITDGIFAGVGAVIVFVPQIALLFFFLAILEDSGYLARAAFLMDRLLSKVGLHGKSFIPLLSSFACAIPGIMATRTIENRKDRLATIFVAPFMSCSARLPVYTLLIGTFFAGLGALKQAGIMLSLYALGILAAAGTAWLFKRSMLKGPKSSFILEMPTYKVPQASQVARQVWINTWAFLTKAGTTIFCLSVLLWALAYYPRLPDARKASIATAATHDYWEERVPVDVAGTIFLSRAEIAKEDEAIPQLKQRADESRTRAQAVSASAVASEQLRHSFAGRFGHAIEPAIKPLGYDWKMGVGLVGAFAAREVFVSTMGIVYSVGGDDEDTTPLAEQMKNDRYPSGQPVWTPLVAVSLLVWFVLAMQCMSTLAIVRRETGGWKWPIAMLVYMNALAYVVALLVYQVGSRLV
jgi:ferrous iron transport protein B